MNLKKYIWTLAAVVALGAVSCSDDKTDIDDNVTTPPIPDITPGEVVLKPKSIWIDAHANFQLLSTKAGIDGELAKIKRYGLNMIYLDVKPGNGYALYKSDIVPYCNQFADIKVNRDYDDFLGYFLEKCEELDIDVIASLGALGYGYHDKNVKQGLVYDEWDKWKDKLQTRNDLSDVNKVVTIAEDDTQPAVMLDPIFPEVQDLLVSLCEEIVRKYPKIKGISLDYLRYNNNDGGYYGLGDADLSAFASYWNEATPKRTDIITPTGGQGPKFAQWVEFRSMMITNLLERVNHAVKAIRPDCEIHLWASSHWESRYMVGQNWASKSYIPTGMVYTPTYNRTGFADLIDVFVTGAYAEKVWKKDNPSSPWTVENFCLTWNNYIKGDCKCYGSIAAYALNQQAISDATYLCLKHTDGYMTFELSHVNNGSKWLATLDGIQRYEGTSEE